MVTKFIKNTCAYEDYVVKSKRRHMSIQPYKNYTRSEENEHSENSDVGPGGIALWYSIGPEGTRS